MIELFYREDAIKDANKLVERCHYSHRGIPHSSYCATWHQKGGLFGNYGRIVAACIFASYVGSAGSLFSKAPMLELKRLIRDDDLECNPLTGLISKACKRIKELGIADLLISYADEEEEHHGGIYQACSWNYNGFRKASSGNYLLINGKKVGTRAISSRFGTNRLVEVRKAMPSSTIEKYKDDGKYLYWRALNKNGIKWAGDLNFQKLPYPKPRT